MLKLPPFAVLILATLASASCDADDCLRALRANQPSGRLQAAQSFCATFTETSSVPPTAIPAYAADACKQNQNGDPTYRLSSACICIASSTIATPPTTTSALTNPCAVISDLAASQTSTAPHRSPTIPAKLAQECFEAVPLFKGPAIKLLDDIVPYLDWQSDLEWVKDPPSGYFYPPHDILGSLATVRENVQNDVYSGEIAFELDLYSVFAKAHDGHLVFYPDGLGSAFQWARQRSLVSISKDSSSLPGIYLYEDVTSSPSTASVVTEIDGVDAATFVGDFAYESSLNQDPDAGYNTMFFSPQFTGGLISHTGYFAGGGRTRFQYPGENTTFTFANGTVLTIENIAYVIDDFTGVIDGESFLKAFCPGIFSNLQTKHVLPAPKTPISSTLLTGQSAQIYPPGYPVPWMITIDNSIGGYFLQDVGFEDVAVLSVLSFAPVDPWEFQNVAEQFCVEAVKAGKTKLIIDLSANGGGYILQGYDLFRQFFPDIVQDGFSQLRESSTLLEAAKVFSDVTGADFNPQTSGNETLISMAEFFLNRRYDHNITDQPFESFEDKFGPYVTKGQTDTNLLRWNLDDPLTTTNKTFGMGIEITGYGGRKNFTQPFKQENIIILTDGYCASTCSLFSEFMRHQGGVKVVALGGRPKAGPIQAIGGTKGAQVLTFEGINTLAQLSIAYAPLQTPPDPTTTLSELSLLPMARSLGSSINIRDQILRDNVNDGMPAQFLYEPAECRLYYTLPMISNVSNIWEATATAAFNGGGCAAGGLPKRNGETRVKMPSVSGERGGKRMRSSSQSFKKDNLWDARHGRGVIE